MTLRVLEDVNLSIKSCCFAVGRWVDGFSYSALGRCCWPHVECGVLPSCSHTLCMNCFRVATALEPSCIKQPVSSLCGLAPVVGDNVIVTVVIVCCVLLLSLAVLLSHAGSSVMLLECLISRIAGSIFPYWLSDFVSVSLLGREWTGPQCVQDVFVLCRCAHSFAPFRGYSPNTNTNVGLFFSLQS